MKLSIWNIALCASFLPIIFGCSEDSRNAGGVTDIGNSIAGNIVFADGVTPARGARVVAYEDSWKNLGIADSVEAFADSLGNFVLENVSENMRVLYASDQNENALVDLHGDTLRVVLGRAKTLAGKMAAETSGSLRVVGTSLLAAVNADGEFSFDSIPSGDISLSYTKNSAPRSRFDFRTVDAREAIDLPALKTFSEADSILVVADAALYADTSLGVALGTSLSTAISVSLLSSPTETLKNFVLPVKFNNKIDFSAFADPDSFRVVSESGAVQKFEVDYWTPHASQGVLWVRLDSLVSGTENVNLYLINRDDSGPRDRAFSASDSVLATVHMNGDAHLYAASDSNRAYGLIGYGTTVLPGQYIPLDSVNPFTGDFTLSLWALWNGPDDSHQVLFARRATADSIVFQWYFDNINSAFAVYNVLHWDSIAGAAAAVDTTRWNLLSLVSRNDSVSMFVNGTQVGETVPFELSHTDADVPFRVGGNDVAEESWNGAVDEIHVTAKARSAEWIRMEYETQRAAAN